MKGQLENIDPKEEVDVENTEVVEAVGQIELKIIEERKMMKKLNLNQPQVIEVATKIGQMVSVGKS